MKNFTKKLLCGAALFMITIVSNAADRLLIVGDAVWGGYSIDNSIVMFNSDADPDVWKATVNLKADSEFKFLTTTDWGGLEFRAGDSDVTLISGVEASLFSSESNSNDCKFKVDETANYDIVCDIKNGKITVTKAAYQTNAIYHTGLWLVGDATPGGWSIDNATAMEQNATDPMKFTVTAELVNGEFKIAINKHTGFGQTMFVRDAADNGKIVFGGDDNKWNITKSGKYDITVDLAAMTISVKEHQTAGLNTIDTTDTETVPVYFTLDGKKVNSLQAGGYYIIRCGTKTVKVCR